MKKNGPWTIKSSEVKYKNPWIEVREDQVIRPGGKDGIYGVVNFGEEGGIAVLPIDTEGNIFLLQAFSYALGKTEIGIVAGSIEKGESVHEAAARELQEEAGIEASQWESLGIMNPLTAYTNHKHHLFLAQELSFVERHLEPTESMELYKLPLSQAIDMIMDGTIANEITALVILKAEQFLRKRGV